MSTPTTPLPWPRLADDGQTPLGIDLATKSEDVRLILTKHFAQGHNLDMDDLLQEVYCAILRKNRQPCAFDSRRASFGHYVYIVGRSTMCNLLHAEKQFRAHHVAGNDDAVDPHDPIGAYEDAMSAGVDVEALRAEFDAVAVRAGTRKVG